MVKQFSNANLTMKTQAQVLFAEYRRITVIFHVAFIFAFKKKA